MVESTDVIAGINQTLASQLEAIKTEIDVYGALRYAKERAGNEQSPEQARYWRTQRGHAVALTRAFNQTLFSVMETYPYLANAVKVKYVLATDQDETFSSAVLADAGIRAVATAYPKAVLGRALKEGEAFEITTWLPYDQEPRGRGRRTYCEHIEFVPNMVIYAAPAALKVDVGRPIPLFPAEIESVNAGWVNDSEYSPIISNQGWPIEVKPWKTALEHYLRFCDFAFYRGIDIPDEYRSATVQKFENNLQMPTSRRLFNYKFSEKVLNGYAAYGEGDELVLAYFDSLKVDSELYDKIHDYTALAAFYLAQASDGVENGAKLYSSKDHSSQELIKMLHDALGAGGVCVR